MRIWSLITVVDGGRGGEDSRVTSHIAFLTHYSFDFCCNVFALCRLAWYKHRWTILKKYRMEEAWQPTNKPKLCVSRVIGGRRERRERGASGRED